MSGCFVAVVGPSGAGKDTLIAAARDRLAGDPRFVFARRVVTRRDGGNEDHDFLDAAVFPAAVKAGAFALSWGAHGLYYGIPDTVRRDVTAGRIVVANLSRGAVEDARRLFPRVRVALVTAPAEVLAARLAGRARASDGSIDDRLKATAAPIVGPDVTVIDNGGRLEDAVAAFADLLGSLAGQ